MALQGRLVRPFLPKKDFDLSRRFYEALGFELYFVDDLDAWWTQVQDLDLPGRFGVPEPKTPTMQAWGRRVAFIIDPAGVLWHVLEHAGGT